MSSSADSPVARTMPANAPDLVARLATLDPHVLAPDDVQLLMAMAVRAYSDLVERGHAMSPLAPGSDVTATDAVRAASGILKALDLETFELALWQMFGGGPERRDPGTGGLR